jgi:hypothetical protein
MKRDTRFDFCGCKDEKGWPQHYATCPFHGETPYDRGARAGRSEVFEWIRVVAFVVGLMMLLSFGADYNAAGEMGTRQAPVLATEAAYDAGGQAALHAVRWIFLAVSVIVFVVVLVAEAVDRPRFRR